MTKVISPFILIASIFLFMGCGENCNPTYLPNSSVFENTEQMNGLPVRVKTEDSRDADKKNFLKLGFMTYHDIDSKRFNSSQYVKLARPSKEIIQTAFAEGFKRCGFTLNKDACVVADISVKKFLCTISGSKYNDAVIELDFALKENDKIIYQKFISETYKQKFNAFRQNEDVEPLLSKCLTMAIENTLASAEFTNHIAANAQLFQLVPVKTETLTTNIRNENKDTKAGLSCTRTYNDDETYDLLINTPIYGIRLGDDIKNIPNNYEAKIVRYKPSNYVAEIKPPFDEVRKMTLYLYNKKYIRSILVGFNNPNLDLFNNITNAFEKKYNVISKHIYDNYIVYTIEIDGKEVFCTLTHRSKSDGAVFDEVQLHFGHTGFKILIEIDKLNIEKQKRKLAEETIKSIEGNL